jgi:hypothetical protein
VRPHAQLNRLIRLEEVRIAKPTLPKFNVAFSIWKGEALHLSAQWRCEAPS